MPPRPICSPASTGWLYPAVILDLCSRRIVGWALADHVRADLTVAARSHTRGLSFHSDRCSQHGSKAHRALLRNAGLRQGLFARANPYHNALSECLIGWLKAEMVQGGSFLDAADARAELFAYIEGYYNTPRRHSSLACPPASF